MERTIKYVDHGTAFTAYGVHYRTPEVAGSHGIVVFEPKAEHVCSADDLAWALECRTRNGSTDSPAEAGPYLDRFGGRNCHLCHAELGWSPNWVAYGVFGEGTLEHILCSLERRLEPFGLTDPKEFLWNSLTNPALFLEGEVVIDQQPKAEAPAKKVSLKKAPLTLVQ